MQSNEDMMSPVKVKPNGGLEGDMAQESKFIQDTFFIPLNKPPGTKLPDSEEGLDSIPKLIAI